MWWQIILIILAVLAAVMVFGVIVLLMIGSQIEKMYPYITGNDETDMEDKINE